MSSNPVLDSHNKDVQNVAAAVKQSFAEKRPFRIYHGHTNSTRQNVLKKNESVDVSMLNRVLSFNLEEKTVLVEPNVAMDSLVQATLKHGLIPAVVPEFPGITVGGAYAGTAGESSSFRWGFFDRLVGKAEVVLADGRVVVASGEGPEKELFERLPSTIGTLGVVTACEVRLETAKRFVETMYVRVGSMEEATRMIKNHLANKELDFLDGIMFSPTEGAVVMGKLTNSIPGNRKPQKFSGAWDPWYYMHVQSRVATSSSLKGEATMDWIPIADYLFRYDRGGFWVGRSAFKYMHFPFNRLTRWFLDDFLHTRMLYRALHASKNVIGYVVQDLALPYETAPKFVEFTDKEFQIYPLWLCPLKESQEDVGKESFHPWLAEESNGKTTMKPMLNIGLWGLPPPTAKTHKDYVRINQRLEKTLHDLKGLKWLYSRTYYTASEFWSYYPKDWYDALRKKYRAEHLPDVWQKVHVDVVKESKEMEGWKARVLSVWPVAGLYGCWKGMWSGEWKVARKVRIGEMDVVEQQGGKEE